MNQTLVYAIFIPIGFLSMAGYFCFYYYKIKEMRQIRRNNNVYQTNNLSYDII
jgi:hypothetical protein